MKNGRLRPLAAVSTLMLAAALLGATLTVQPAAAQSEPSDQEKAMHYSLYYENFKNENYQDAMSDLRWILANAPGYPRNDDRNYERMVEAFLGMAENAQGDQKKTYLDSALAYVERAPEELQAAGAEVDPYTWKLEKGRILQSHSDAFPNSQEESLLAYREAYDLNPQELDPYYIERLILSYLQSNKKDEAINFMDDLEAKRGEDEKVAQLLSQYRDRVFTSPEERIGYLESQLEKNPDDTEVMTELFDLYMQTGQRNEAGELANRLMDAEPNPRILRTLAKMRLEDGESQEAFDLYEQSVEMDDEEPTAEVFYNMGLAQQQMGRASQARTYFRRALEVDSGFGQAYMAIGDLYANAVSECGGELEREDRAVYWLVVDKYQQAKSADPNLASAANQQISTYRQYFPSAEDKFFKGWEAGQSYPVNYGCYSWIGESTTVK